MSSINVRRLKLVLLVCALSCSSSTDVEIGGVVASASSGEIAITNLTTKPVFTFVLGRNSAALALWAPCVDPQQCESLAPRESKRVPYPAAFGGVKETEALVNWWHLVPNPSGGFKPDSIRVGIVPLK